MSLTRTRKKRKPSKSLAPRCTVRGCKDAAKIAGWCVKHAEREADKRFSLMVRERGPCQFHHNRGDCAGPLQAAHIFSRRYHATRYEPANCQPLCAGAHRFLDTHEAHKQEWAVRLLSRYVYEELRKMALAGMDRRASVEAFFAALSATEGEG